MSDTVYRLMERHQKLDALLTQARSRRFPNALELDTRNNRDFGGAIIQFVGAG